MVIIYLRGSVLEFVHLVVFAAQGAVHKGSLDRSPNGPSNMPLQQTHTLLKGYVYEKAGRTDLLMKPL